MKRAHVSPLLLVLTAVISLSCGIGITLAAEDLVGVPLESNDSQEMSIPDEVMEMALEDMLEFIEENPELAEELTEVIREKIENGEYTAEELEEILGEHPELADEIAEQIKEKIESGEYTMEELMDMLEEHPELAGALGGYLGEYLEGLEGEGEGEEPGLSGGTGGQESGGCTIDTGQYDPDAPDEELFTVDSTYKGTVYIRGHSVGDYIYGTGEFEEAPEFDGSIYSACPLLYAGYSFESVKNWSSQTLTFHLSDAYSGYGMLVGDYCGKKYTISESGESKFFSTSTESRMRRVDCKEYSVSFYPDDDPTKLNLPSYLEAEEKEYYKFARANYKSVPEELGYALDTFIKNNFTSSKPTPTEVERFIKNNFTYKAQAFSPSAGQDHIQYFLESDERVGTCSNFASAMTMICRRLGYPARLVSGFMINASRGENVVLSKSAHAWVEVYNDGHGWVRYDPTPASKEEEAGQTGGSNGEVGDDAYGFGPDAEENLFSFTSDYKGTVYLRSASFLDYDPDTSKFTLDDIAAENSSLLYASSALQNSIYPSYSITMHMGEYRDTGMIFASYPSSTYETDSFSEELRPVSDGRFFREDVSEYTYDFYPDAAPDYSIDHPDYYNSYCSDGRPYRQLPNGYRTKIDSFCNANSINSLSELASFFNNKCDLDNSLTGYEGDMLAHFLDTDASSGSYKGNSSIYAGIYTLLARYFKKAARFVSGYKLTSNGKKTTVGEDDAYYWVEIYEEGFGWKRVDPIDEMMVRPEEKTKLILSAKGSEKSYNGSVQSPTVDENIEVDSETPLFPGDYISYAEFPSVLTTAFCVESASLPFRNVRISDKHGNDVTDCYELDYSSFDFEAEYKVTKKKIYVFTQDITWEADSSVEITQAFLEGLIDKDSLRSITEIGDTYDISYPDGAIGTHSVGDKFMNSPILTIKNKDGVDVTDQYEITYNYGYVSINAWVEENV